MTTELVERPDPVDWLRKAIKWRDENTGHRTDDDRKILMTLGEARGLLSEIERLKIEANSITGSWLETVGKVVNARNAARAKLAEAVAEIEQLRNPPKFMPWPND